MKIQYFPNPVHRNRTLGKSQWTISPPDERRCFDHALEEKWTDNAKAWGLHLVASAPEYLGVGRDHVTRVFVAQFLDTARSRTWHGFPVDFLDRPPEWVLGKWSGLLDIRIRRKLSQGQPCSL